MSPRHEVIGVKDRSRHGQCLYNLASLRIRTDRHNCLRGVTTRQTIPYSASPLRDFIYCEQSGLDDPCAEIIYRREAVEFFQPDLYHDSVAKGRFLYDRLTRSLVPPVVLMPCYNAKVMMRQGRKLAILCHTQGEPGMNYQSTATGCPRQHRRSLYGL